MDRYHLRQSYALALGELFGTLGESKLARLTGVSRDELRAIVHESQPPTVSDRTRLIQFLVRNGHGPKRGDPYAPDGSEPVMMRKAERRMTARSEEEFGMLPRADVPDGDLRPRAWKA
jgi:hypothetical protein